MTLKAQRIAIAEACGWVSDGSVSRPRWVRGAEKAQLTVNGGELDQGVTWLPNCPFDLNAMHEVEKTLNTKEQEDYCDVLCDMLAEDDPDPPVKSLLFATAAQRAEAFLRTLGLYNDEL